MSTSQEDFNRIQFEHAEKLRKVKSVNEAGQKAIYNYRSLALIEQIEKRRSEARIPQFHDEFSPDFTEYQYDLEFYCFLNHEALYKRELEMAQGARLKLLEQKGAEYGATLCKKQEHLERAISIRWPEKVLATGEVSTALALTPWAKDFLYGVTNYKNIVTFGGGGQGKTYTSIAFMVMLYDHFIFTKSGAQCSFSTVSETKLKTSIWSHLNKLYSWKNKHQFSKMAGNAHQAPEYTFRRKNTQGKYIEEGGTMKGILLVQGAKTAKQIDKLTGQHDVVARAYLLDEAQSTGPAPLQAYNNMFLHPKYGWFMMAGNYDEDTDLLGINTKPNDGWESVDETTHMWEGTLKSPDSDLGHESLIIHYNNELSPGMTDPAMAKRYAKFLMTPEKKRRLYKTKEDEETYEAKRFWVGFRFEKKKESVELVVTTNVLKEYKAYDKKDFRTDFVIGSLDIAHSTERDRSIFTSLDLGLDEKGFPMVSLGRVRSLVKPSSALSYYKENSANIKEILEQEGIGFKGRCIMDWTQRSQLLEGLADMGVIFRHLIYQQSPPNEIKVNDITKELERPIELETVPTFQDGFERDIKVFAHDKIENRITLGAYIFRLFVEKGRCRNFNYDAIRHVPGVKSFEEEICLRYFQYTTHRREQKIRLDDKNEFKKKRKFSPDILDTIFQAFYMMYVNMGIRPDKPGLGNLVKEDVKKPVDNSRWNARLRFRGSPNKQLFQRK